MALGYPNPSYLKKAQLKQQSLYNANLLLEEHDPPAVYDSEETLELAQERVIVPQTTKSKEELFLSNISNMVTVSKAIFIPNADNSDDTTLSVARKLLNEVKSSLVTLQRVVKQKMTLEVHNWSSSAHKEVVQIYMWCVDSGCSKHMTGNIKLLINFVWKFLGTVRFWNDHIAAILSYGDVKWGNITITRVYFVEVLGHNLFSVGQFCDADLEVAFRRNTCFIRDLDGTNEKMVSKFNCVSWQVVQIYMWCVDSGCSKHMTGNIKLLINFVWKFLGTVRFWNDHIAAILSYGDVKWGNITITRVYFVEGNRSTNLYTINLYDMASASPICLMARATPTKSWLWHQRLSHLNFDTINDLAKNDLVSGLPKFKYAKEHLCPSCEQRKSKRASHPPKPVSNLKQRLHLLHMDLWGPMRVTSINGKREYFDSIGITHETSAAKTPQQNGVVERRNHTLVEAARTMLIFSHAPLFLWAESIATASMAFEQNCSRPGLQSMTSGQISFELELTYALSTITPQRPSERDMYILFEPLHNEYLGGRPSEAPRAIPAAPVLQNLQAPTASMSFQDSAPAPTNSLNTPVSSHNVDAPSPQHAQQQRNHTPLLTASVADNVLNATFEGDLFVNPFGTPFTEIFLAYAAHKGSIVYQMDVKTAFLHGSLEEDVYMCQPEGFIDADYTSHVYKLKKAPGIFINQSKYVHEILKKYGLNTCDIVGTPTDIKDKLDLDQIRTLVDATKYRSMIGALMYLTSSRPDIVYATCVCARYQAHPTEKHLKEVKRIFRYLWVTVNMGLCYTKDSGFELTGFSDADYAGCKDTFKRTSGRAQFLGEKIVS
nr:hypothetical protein [Tanacetum cinerariifolium]